MSLRPAVFLDRDGTLIVEKNYLADPGQVELLPGAGEALRELAAAGYALVVITNQSGIARGLFGLHDYFAVEGRLRALLEERGVRLDGSYYCPHHPDFGGPCDCRKPGLALYHRAASELGLDLARSACVGDRLGDVLPARAFGARAILVRTGYGATEASQDRPGIEVAADLPAAAALILAGRSAPPG